MINESSIAKMKKGVRLVNCARGELVNEADLAQALKEKRVASAALDVFIEEVIPLLQRRGLFRTVYEGEMLREHYGLAWPKSAFAAAPL